MEGHDVELPVNGGTLISPALQYPRPDELFLPAVHQRRQLQGANRPVPPFASPTRLTGLQDRRRAAHQLVDRVLHTDHGRRAGGVDVRLHIHTRPLAIPEANTHLDVSNAGPFASREGNSGPRRTIDAVPREAVPGEGAGI